jgi:hypothetical protein
MAEISLKVAAFGSIIRVGGGSFLVDYPSPQPAHDVFSPVTALGSAFFGKGVHDPLAASTWILQVEIIDPG